MNFDFNMSTMEWLCFLGIDAIILGIFRYLFSRLKKVRDDNKAVKMGIQALLRNQLINCWNKWHEKGYAPIYARENFEKMWEEYHNLGGNGVIDDIHHKFLELPTSLDEE